MRLLLVVGLAALGAASCGHDGPTRPAYPPLLSTFPRGTFAGTHVPGYRDDRPVHVWLPPGFSPLRRYPVLVVLDGTSAFGGDGTFEIDRVVDSLLAERVIAPTIVVGVASAAGHQRFTEYLPREGGEQFLLGLRDTLLPAMRAGFAVTSDPDSTSLIGASLGGLMAAYAGFAHGDTFRRVAALSVSYPYEPSTVPTAMRTFGRGALARFYQDTGDFDDNPFDMLQSIEALARDSLGMVPDCDIKTVLAHGRHDVQSWAHRMPSILAYLLGPPCAASPAPAQVSFRDTSCSHRARPGAARGSAGPRPPPRT